MGPFRVLRAIAAGGMAEVYAVEDPTSGERFALKLLISVTAALKRFNREYEAMTRLNHAGIVRVYHYGLHQGHPWLTMELLRGTPAQPWVKKFGKPGLEVRTNEVLRLGYHLSRALHYVHERGLVHRDLKSANVLVLPDRRVKLIDFGTAHLSDALDRLTGQGEFVGTYAYASPEQLLGNAVDGRSDLYSMGVLLYRLCTGRRPYSLNDPAQLLDAHVNGAIPDPRTLVPNLPAGLAELIVKLMAKAPGDRPPNAGFVAQRLEELAGRPFGIRSPLAVHDAQVTSREHELRQIRGILEEQTSSAVIVLGEAGSDRGRLVDALLREAVGREDTVFTGTLREGADIEGLMGLLKAVARQGSDSDTAIRALHKLAKANVTQLATPRVRASLRKSVQSAFSLLAEKKQVVIGVHGLEHATTLTLEVLANVRAFAQESGLHIHILASCSARHMAGNPEIARRFPDAVYIDLPPLGPREIALGVGLMLGRRPPPAELSRELFAATDGQPIYLEDAVQELVATGGIEADDGNRLEWAGAEVEVPVPPRARADAETVLASLPFLHRRVLEASALLDEEIHLDLLAAALDWELDEVRWVARDLVEQQILRWVVVDDVIAWIRGRLKAVLEDGLVGPRRTVHHLTLARAIRPHSPSAAQVRMLLATGESGEAFRRCTIAAREAFEGHRYRDAHAMLNPLFRREQGVPTQLVAEAHLLNARCLHVLRPLDTAAARSLATARKGMVGNPQKLAEVDFATAMLSAAIGHHRNHHKHLDAAWEAAEAANSADLRAMVAIEHADTAYHRGSQKDCQGWLDKARSAAMGARDRSLMGFITISSARLALMAGEAPEAEGLASKAMQYFEREGDIYGYFTAVATWADTLRRQGRWSEALALLTQRLPEARLAEDPQVYVRMLLAAAWCEIDLCRLGRAQELVDELAATVRKGELLALQLEARLVYGRILLASGQFMNAAFVLKEVHERARNAQLTVVAEISRALWAETSWHLRDRTRSRELFQSALLGLRGTGSRIGLADACAARARVMAREIDPAEIFKPVAEILDGGLLPSVGLERTLAIGQWERQRGDRGAMAAAYRTAALSLNRLASQLNDTDRAALRVHPWSRRIRRGLR
ncbi:MAG: protein kinase [Myxococcota bacterium]